VVRTQTSLQNALLGLMNTPSKDEYETRLWSTCPGMLSIDGVKGKNEDKLESYIIDDSNCPLSLTGTLECVQNSVKQLLKVSVSGQTEVNDCFGDLYAHLLIEAHTHTTHYVNISKEFPIDKDIDTQLSALSPRCKISVSKTEIIVLVEFESTEETQRSLIETNTTEDSEQSTTKESKIVTRPMEILNKLLERLLIDGIHKVVVLTNRDITMAFPRVFEEVMLRVEEVSIYLCRKKQSIIY
jgi:hypothetical protein